MARPLLLLRPQPGNDQSAARARALGLAVVQLPLFEIVAAPFAALPAGPFDALLVTSANGVRFGAAALARFADLPAFAVGGATAAALDAAGHHPIVTGTGEAAGTAVLLAAAGHVRVLHICGADVRPFDPRGLVVTRHIVYRAAETDEASVSAALSSSGQSVAAVHSPRAGRRLAALVGPAARAQMQVAAISAAAAAACGPGWAEIGVASSPDDTALLHVAQTLCNSAG